MSRDESYLVNNTAYWRFRIDIEDIRPSKPRAITADVVEGVESGEDGLCRQGDREDACFEHYGESSRL